MSKNHRFPKIPLFCIYGKNTKFDIFGVFAKKWKIDKMQKMQKMGKMTKMQKMGFWGSDSGERK